MPTIRAPRRRVARPRPRPAPRAPAGPDAPLPAALLPELAVVLADIAWALARKEDADDAAGGES